MSTLYLDRKNLELKITSGTLGIYKDGSKQSSVPLKMLERIVTRGDIKLSTAILAELATQKIGFTAISGRKGEKIANLTGATHNDAKRRLAQYQSYSNKTRRNHYARETIKGKIHNQQRFIQQLLKSRPDCRYPLTKAEQTLQKIQQQFTQETLAEQLLGFEGAAAAAYFAGLKSVFPPSLNFTGRNRRPPKDPVNACLSLSYTMIHTDAIRACHIAGLDPLIGMLHKPAHGRESLASDLIEPLRPHIDRWVWELFRERILEADHFHTEGEGCFLGKTGRKIYYKHWEQRAPGLRRWLRQQSRWLVKDFLTSRA